MTWMLLLASAWACDTDLCDHTDTMEAEVTITGQMEEEEEEDHRAHDPRWTAVRGDSIHLDGRQTWGLAVRSNGRHDSWIGVEGRWAEDQAWMGRFGMGFDVFGHKPFDLRLGLMAGHLGDWQTPEHQRFSVGTVVDLGWNPGRFLFEHRHIGGRRPDGRGIRTEGHTQIGVRPLERLEVYADFTVIAPEAMDREVGMGVGLGWRF